MHPSSNAQPRHHRDWTSTGGIQALQTIAAALPENFPGSVFAVLHTTEDNTGLLPPLLNKVSRVPAFYAVHNTPIFPGRIYLAPPGRHLVVERGRVRLSVGPRENRHRPAADVLFRSAALAYGPRVIGVVATGHLDDGSSGLAGIKARGGIAVVQAPETARSIDAAQCYRFGRGRFHTSIGADWT